MELIKIKGNTYFIDAPTNIGVYVFKNKNCLLVDSGINNSAARKIDEILSANGLHPKYIVNTHSHLDHCGGNNYFTENYPGCIVYTSQLEKLNMENTHLFPSMLFSANSIKELQRSNKPFPVNFVLDYGLNKINDEKFHVVSLKGHSVEHIGLITPEKVCFLGDSIFSSHILGKYSFPYLYDIESSLKTLVTIKEIDADFFVISHAKEILNKEQVIKLAEDNIENINNYSQQILELLDQPLTREEVLENISVLNELAMDFNQYHLNFSGISAFIAYLFSKGLVDYSVEDGKLYYFKKPQ